MQAENHTFLQILRINDCELWQLKNGHTTCRTRGFLQVLYSKVLDLFLLRVNEFKWALDGSLEILGTYSEGHRWSSYMIPNPEGFYLVKLVESSPGPAIENLNTILSARSKYIPRTDLENKIDSFREEERHPSNTEMLKESIVKTFEGIVKSITPHEVESQPNQKMVRTLDQLIDINSHGTPVVDIPNREIETLRETTQDLSRGHQSNTYWREYRGDVDDSNLAGSGLTSQSMGVETRREPEVTSAARELVQNPAQGSMQDRIENTNIGQCSEIGQNSHIKCVHQNHSTDSQEVLGSENQRLPAYEVHHTRKHVRAGFRKASANLDPALLNSGAHPQEEEDDSFTTGLMSGPIPEAYRTMSETRTGEDQTNEYTYKPRVHDIQQQLSMQERWGSNISNRSKSIRTASDTDFNTELPSLKPEEPLSDKPLKADTNENPAPSDNLPKAGLVGKETNTLQEKTSDLNKHKKAPITQALDKENVGTGYVL